MSTDYDCLCTQYTNLLTCYNNCPNDSGVTTVQQQREQYCTAASAYPSTSSTVAPLTSGSSSTAALTNTASTTSETAVVTGFATGSGSGSAASASATSSSDSGNGAAGLDVVGSLMAAVALAGLRLVL